MSSKRYTVFHISVFRVFSPFFWREYGVFGEYLFNLLVGRWINFYAIKICKMTSRITKIFRKIDCQQLFSMCSTQPLSGHKMATSGKVGIYSSFCLSKSGDFTEMGQDIGLNPSANERELKNKHPGGWSRAFGTKYYHIKFRRLPRGRRPVQAPARIWSFFEDLCDIYW